MKPRLLLILANFLAVTVQNSNSTAAASINEANEALDTARKAVERLAAASSEPSGAALRFVVNERTDAASIAANLAEEAFQKDKDRTRDFVRGAAAELEAILQEQLEECGDSLSDTATEIMDEILALQSIAAGDDEFSALQPLTNVLGAAIRRAA